MARFFFNFRQASSYALARSPAGVAIAVSGVLGPSADEDGNPIGLVYFGFRRRGQEPQSVRKHYGDGSSEILRRTAVCDALRILGDLAEG